MNVSHERRETVSASGSAETTQVSSRTVDPVFILAPPCTFSWIICAMIGQHPQMYGLPELHLFTAETIAGWLDLGSRESYDLDHGLVRAVAEIYFGGQTDYTITRARGWLRRRAHFTTGLLFEAIADRLSPLVPIEKSPSTVASLEFLQRAFDMFPKARFLHLVSHPRIYGDSVMQALREAEMANGQPLPQSHWLVHLATYPHPVAGDVGPDPVLDPQQGWFALNTIIVHFLNSVPDDQKRTVRGEDLLADSDHGLVRVAAWLGLRTDSEVIEQMRHPEHSPFARAGPTSAPFGSDIFLRAGPLVRPDWLEPASLEGPLSWRADNQGFVPEVTELAKQFGYR